MVKILFLVALLISSSIFAQCDREEVEKIAAKNHKIYTKKIDTVINIVHSEIVHGNSWTETVPISLFFTPGGCLVIAERKPKPGVVTDYYFDKNRFLMV